MKLLRQSRLNLISLIFVLACIGLMSCAGGPEPNAPMEESGAFTGPKLEKAYSNIVVLNFDSTVEIKKDYPDAADESQSSMISALQMTNAFKSVTAQKDDSGCEEGTLLVKVYISDLNIVGFWPRFWIGALAGNSYMDCFVSLIDGGTKQELRKKEINSANNAIAAAWAFGSSDRSLPSDMGEIIADYILSTVPHK